jgi:hypothetical protein
MIDRDWLTKKEFGLEKAVPDPALPITTRTKTDAENRAVLKLAMPFLILCWIGLCIGSGFYVYDAGQSIVSAIVAVVGVGLANVFVWRPFARRRRQLRKYRDPQISVEVRETGMVVRAPGHVHELAFAGAVYTPLFVSPRGGTHFWGIKLETPIGPLSIENTCFNSGRRAAGAIVRRIEAARESGGR